MFDILAGIGVTPLLFVSFILLLTIGVPIAYALGAATLLVLYAQGMPGVFMPQTAYNATDNFPLMAVPFFVLAGYLMEFGGLSQRLIDFAETLIGGITGGLAAVTILACIFFSAISGSGPATVAAIGTIMIPAMIRYGYNAPLAGAVASTGGTIGIMIPPSNPMIIYGVVGNVSYSFRDKGRAFLRAFWALLAPVIVLGGIYTGVFTPTEASVIAVAYGLFAGAVVYRELTWGTLYRALLHAVVICGTVTIMVGLAGAFGRILTNYHVPQQVGNLILGLSDNWFVVLMMINVVLIIIGTFMETLATIIILTPILLPVVTQLGVDPIHFGILLVVTSELGFLTPPLGANLFVAAQIARVNIESLSVAVLPYIIVLTCITVVLTAFPQISLLLPNLLR
jgi:C4-dicarboxylate transporter DctM subunit